MPDVPTVSLRTRTDDDLDVLYRIAADLDSWEERNPSGPGPLTRAKFDARLASAADSDASEQTAAFVVDVNGAAVGSASLFGFDSFARHAEADGDPALRAVAAGPTSLEDNLRPICRRKKAGRGPLSE